MILRRIVFSVIVCVLLVGSAPAAAWEIERISRPGEYRGFSMPVYDDWARESFYVEVRDGTRLAVDLFRPTVDGVIVEDPLPVLWTHHRYRRAHVNGAGQLISLVDERPELATIIKHGYVIAAVDVRGGGASFGFRRGPFSPEETQDAYDLTEWFAEQSWCDSNVGMFGLSYLAVTQYMAASTKPPHLKAIFPMMAMFDLYGFSYVGGVLNENFLLNWGGGNMILDRFQLAAPVDDDSDQALLKAAAAEHADNWNIYLLAKDMPYRDSSVPIDQSHVYAVNSPSSYLDEINASGVAIYTLGGWYDTFGRDAAYWYNNVTGPRKLTYTPWSHNGSGGFDLVAEHLRWFDYWLKGIENGVMDEPPVQYYVMGANEWRTADQWPLPDEQPTPLYFGAGPLGSIDSVNDGGLTFGPPAAAEGQDVYTVDTTTTTGKTTRWTDGYGGGFGYSSMNQNDEKALTYTTPPLTEDMEITGHPVAHLWVSVDASDADVMVYLEEADTQGRSDYISEGTLKASYRALSEAPWNTFGLPYHSGLAADVAPLEPGEIVELVIELQPTSNVFDAGNRIRITVTGADADTFLTPVDVPSPTLTVYRNATHASYVVLPVIPAN